MFRYFGGWAKIGSQKTRRPKSTYKGGASRGAGAEKKHLINKREKTR